MLTCRLRIGPSMYTVLSSSKLSSSKLCVMARKNGTPSTEPGPLLLPRCNPSHLAQSFWGSLLGALFQDRVNPSPRVASGHIKVIITLQWPQVVWILQKLPTVPTLLCGEVSLLVYLWLGILYYTERGRKPSNYRYGGPILPR